MNSKTLLVVFLFLFSTFSLIHSLPIPCKPCGKNKGNPSNYASGAQTQSQAGQQRSLYGNPYQQYRPQYQPQYRQPQYQPRYHPGYGSGGFGGDFGSESSGFSGFGKFGSMRPRGRALEGVPNDSMNDISGPSDAANEPIVVMKNIPMNPLSDPKKLNVDDIPLVPHNQIVYIQQPYLIVVDKKKPGKPKAANSSTEASGDSSTAATEGGESSTAAEAGGETSSQAAAEGQSSEATTAGTEGSEKSSTGSTVALEN